MDRDLRRGNPVGPECRQNFDRNTPALRGAQRVLKAPRRLVSSADMATAVSFATALRRSQTVYLRDDVFFSRDASLPAERTTPSRSTPQTSGRNAFRLSVVRRRRACSKDMPEMAHSSSSTRWRSIVDSADSVRSSGTLPSTRDKASRECLAGIASWRRRDARCPLPALAGFEPRRGSPRAQLSLSRVGGGAKVEASSAGGSSCTAPALPGARYTAPAAATCPALWAGAFFVV